MRRVVLVATVTMVLLAIGAGSAGAAKPTNLGASNSATHGDAPPAMHGAGKPETAGAGKPATSFSARANHGAQGGHLNLQAKVKHGVTGSTFSATAVVHFASGNVSVTLTRRGKSFNAGGKLPVATDEHVGPVDVDVTVTYNGTDHAVATTGTVVPAGDDDEEDEPDDD